MKVQGETKISRGVTQENTCFPLSCSSLSPLLISLNFKLTLIAKRPKFQTVDCGLLIKPDHHLSVCLSVAQRIDSELLPLKTQADRVAGLGAVQHGQIYGCEPCFVSTGVLRRRRVSVGGVNQTIDQGKLAGYWCCRPDEWITVPVFQRALGIWQIKQHAHVEGQQTDRCARSCTQST